MRVKILIEKLDDLATFLTLANSNAEEQKVASEMRGQYTAGAIWEGRAHAYKIAFNKVDAIIKKAKQ